MKRSESKGKRVKLTPKQRVLKRFPGAFAHWYMDDGCRIYDINLNRLGGGTAPRAAWADAARNLNV